jgi:hypothetical protein
LALEIDPKDIELPAVLAEQPKTPPSELFKYPRSMAVTVLTSLGSQTTGNGIGLWAPTLLYGVVILAPYFATVPRELEEAARIDGCSRFGAFLRVTLPLSTPALASVWCDRLICPPPRPLAAATAAR